MGLRGGCGREGRRRGGRKRGTARPAYLDTSGVVAQVQRREDAAARQQLHSKHFLWTAARPCCPRNTELHVKTPTSLHKGTQKK